MKRTLSSSNSNKNKKVHVEETVRLKGHTKVYSFPAELVPDYKTYQNLENKEDYIIKEKDNTITVFGFNAIPILMSGGTDPVTHCGVGTGSPSSTALGTEVGTRNVITYKYAINNEMHYDTFYGKSEPNSSSNALTEVGLFSASSSGNMFCSNTISFTKSTANTLLIAWIWSFA